MQTGFEIMDYDRNLKDLWVKRTIAGIIDFVIASVITYFLFDFFLKLSIIHIILLQGVIWYIYSVIFDLVGGKTPGKYMVGLRSVAFVGNLNAMQALIRNLTKLNLIIVIGDVVAGLSTEGDPRQRYLERTIDSLVINEHGKERRITKFSVESSHRDELLLPK